MRKRLENCFVLSLGLVFSCWVAQAANRVTEATSVIRAIGPEGSGHVDAMRAWHSLINSNASDLPEILSAMDGANDLAVNWLRAAVETIVDREVAAGHDLPIAPLRRFLLELSHHARARRLAYELILRVDPSGAKKLVVGMVNDPSSELRRDAVQKLMDEASGVLASGDKARAILLFHQTLDSARDVDQIDAIVQQLKSLGQSVDLPYVFGFIMRWKVVGPFDNVSGKGFDEVYPPEKPIDLTAEYSGKNGVVRWSDLEATDEHGNLSMNQPFGALKGVAAYALAEFYADQSRSVEFRLGSENAWKLWLNGVYLFGQNEYHRNKVMDQFIIPAQLRKGLNLILVKVCQNEQTDDWAVGWDFQLRVCDGSGTPVRSTAKPLEGGKQ